MKNLSSSLFLVRLLLYLPPGLHLLKSSTSLLGGCPLQSLLLLLTISPSDPSSLLHKEAFSETPCVNLA